MTDAASSTTSASTANVIARFQASDPSDAADVGGSADGFLGPQVALPLHTSVAQLHTVLKQLLTQSANAAANSKIKEAGKDLCRKSSEKENLVYFLILIFFFFLFFFFFSQSGGDGAVLVLCGRRRGDRVGGVDPGVVGAQHGARAHHCVPGAVTWRGARYALTSCGAARTLLSSSNVSSAQPQAAFKVRPLTRCTAALAG